MMFLNIIFLCLIIICESDLVLKQDFENFPVCFVYVLKKKKKKSKFISFCFFYFQIKKHVFGCSDCEFTLNGIGENKAKIVSDV